ncbi:hypothetical protein CPB85DRAFT_1438179 [Mucidula mucida]|nr:hypothetical protein CPB85DRAFT_1438179 [Mucidula mucida]
METATQTPPNQTPRNPTAEEDRGPLTARLFKPMTMDDADTLSLREQRAALRASTTGHTVQVPVDAYFATYLTDILPSRAETDGLISWLVKELKRGHYLNNSGWARTQVKTGVKEDATYKGLERIAEKIHDLCMTWNRRRAQRKCPSAQPALLPPEP